MESTQGFHAIMNVFLIPLWLMSGALFPATNPHSWIFWAIHLNPVTYGVAAVRRALYAGDPGRAQSAELRPFLRRVARLRTRHVCGRLSSGAAKIFMKIQRALISVSDKTGLADFARELAKQGVEIISTGGTASLLRQEGIPTRDISDFTGFPEMLDGRVKTLHPKVHGGLLYLRGNPEHEAAAREHGIEPIDLVVVNLYPFEETIAKPGVTLAEAIEQIDIGGPSMLRSAAKNYQSVTVVVDPADYQTCSTRCAITTARRR